MAQPVEKQQDKQKASQDSHDQLDRKLIGGNDCPSDQIADQYKKGAEESRICQGSPDLVALKHGYNVWDYQADVGDGTHYDHNGSSNHGGDGQTHKQHQIIRNSQIP